MTDAVETPRQKLTRLMAEHPQARIVTDVGASMLSGWGDLADVLVETDLKNQPALELIFS